MLTQVLFFGSQKKRTEHAGEGAEVKNEVVTLRPWPIPES